MLEHHFGVVPNNLRTMARRPNIVAGLFTFTDAVWDPAGTVPREVKLLVARFSLRRRRPRWISPRRQPVYRTR